MKKQFLNPRMRRYCCFMLAMLFFVPLLNAQNKDTLTTGDPDSGPCGISILSERSAPNNFNFLDTYFFETFAPVPESRTFRRWYFGDGTSAIGKNVSHIFDKPGTYNVTLYKAHYDTLINNDKPCTAQYFDIKQGQYNPCYYRLICENKETVSIVVGEPTLDICILKLDYKFSTPNQANFSDNSGNLGAPGLRTFQKWEFGDGTSATGNNVSHIFEKPGTYNVTFYKALYDTAITHDMACIALAYDMSEGRFNPCYYRLICKNKETFSVVVGESNNGPCGIKLDYKFLSSNQVNFSDNYFLATLIAVPESRTFRRWDFGDGTSATGTNVSHSFNKPGTYNVTLHKEHYDTLINNDKECITQYFDISKGEYDPCHYRKVCENKVTISVVIKEAPDGSCKVDIDYKKSDLTYTFRDKLGMEGESSNTATYYFWDFGDGNYSKEQAVEHTYAKPGTYEVRLTKAKFITTHGEIVCQAFYFDSTIQQTIPCYFKKICAETVNTTINTDPAIVDAHCTVKIDYAQNKEVITFNDFFVLYTFAPENVKTFWRWDFGDGTFSNDKEATHKYRSSGTYKVSLTKGAYALDTAFAKLCFGVKYDSIFNANIFCYYKELCRSANTFEVTIGGIIDHPSVCHAEVLSNLQGNVYAAKDTFNYEKSAYLAFPLPKNHYRIYWQWDFGDKTSNQGQAIKHTYQEPGIYNVTLKKSAYAYDSTLKNLCTKDSTFDEELQMYLPCKFVKECEQYFHFLVQVLPNEQQLCKSELSYKASADNEVYFTENVGQTQTKDAYLQTFYYFNYGDNTSGTSFTHQYPGSGVYYGNYVKAVYRTILPFVACPYEPFDETLQKDQYCGLQLVCRETYKFSVSLNPNNTPCYDYTIYPGDSILFKIRELDITPYDSTGQYPVTYFWDFGDNTSASGPRASHKYQLPGRYQVCLLRSSIIAKYAPCCQWIDVSYNKVIASINPQPFTDNAIFSLQNFEGVYKLEFYDLNGKLMKAMNNNETSNLSLDRAGLTAGLYFYQVVSGEKVLFRGKMVIK